MEDDGTTTKKEASIFVIFGRPGAGKTTIAEAAAARLRDAVVDRGRYLFLDLDVCVPQWMRDNFAVGLYPTRPQRANFIATACAHVRRELDAAESDPPRPLVAVVAFSFVNADLRVAFRAAFPRAQWLLVDTARGIADARIREREGHFYKNVESDGDGIDGGEETSADNPLWEFCPVSFPHVVLDGQEPVEVNAKRIEECIAGHVSPGAGRAI